MLTRRCLSGRLAIVLIVAAVLMGCGNRETGDALVRLPPSPMLLPTAPPVIQTSAQPTVQPTALQKVLTIDQTTPSPVVLGPLFEADLDIRAGPVDVPFELQIPSLKIDAPVLGVGLTSNNVMDSPKGPIDDPVWHTAFWYRGGGIPGEVGTATIAGHINDPLGRSEIFANLEDLQPGDLIIVHYTKSNIDIRFKVEEIQVYSLQESSDPTVLTRIFGTGPVTGTAPQPAPDGLAHLTLITCAGDIVNGQFDHHTVVFATHSK